jgi:hypothetical protein
MTPTVYKEKLRQEFIAQAQSVFERVMAENGSDEGVRLSQIEEKVGELRFELTSKLVESKLKLEVKKQQGPAIKCEGCGREMRDKGKKRRTIMTSQGEIELARSYNHCAHCQLGVFPPGPTIGDQSTRLE